MKGLMKSDEGLPPHLFPSGSFPQEPLIETEARETIVKEMAKKVLLLNPKGLMYRFYSSSFIDGD